MGMRMGNGDGGAAHVVARGDLAFEVFAYEGDFLCGLRC